MASLFAPRVSRTVFLGLGLASASATTYAALRVQRRPLLCESIGDQASGAFRSYQNEAKVPLVTRDGKVNRGIFRQISSGSIAGLVGGLAVSTFSRVLTVLIGVFVAGSQSKGIHVIPTDTIQRYFKNINIKSAVEDNVAFKIAFGTTFALAAFAEF